MTTKHTPGPRESYLVTNPLRAQAKRLLAENAELRAVVEEMSQHTGCGDCIDKARAAIARAKGS